MTESYRVEDLVKVYNVPGKPPVYANNGVNLVVPSGIVFGIFGPNGAGKTTLIRQIVGLLWPTRGRIYLHGVDVVQHPDVIPRQVGYYGQRLVYFWTLSAIELLVFTGRLRGMTDKAAKAQADELISRVGLDHKASRLLATFSGGEIRVVSVLTSLMGNPPVVVLDEPTAELDPVMRQNIWNLLFAVNKQFGTTIILVTHNVLEAEQVVDRVAVIDEGRVVAEGTPSELRASIADKSRVEVRLRVPEAPGILLTGAWTEMRRGVFSCTVPRSEVNSLLHAITGELDPKAVEDVRVVNPTLEDYYVTVVGKQWQ